MTTVFELLGTIAIDSSRANGELDKTTRTASKLNDSLEESGSRADGLSEKLGGRGKLFSASRKLGETLGGMARKAGGYIKDFAISGISMAGRLQRQMHAVETLYGDAAAGVFQNAHNAAKTAGLSANEYMRIANGMASALKGSVETEARTAEIADRTIADMADNASAMGTDMGLIENAYQGFAEQNYAMLDSLRLGYGGTREEMRRLLADASGMAGKEFDISKLSDVFEAIHVIQEGRGIAGMAASQAGDTFLGSMNAAKAAWDNLVSGALLIAIPQLTKLFNEMTAWAEANPDKVREFADALTDIAALSFEGMLEAFRWLTENEEAVSAGLGAFGAAMIVGAVAAHPFLAAITAIVAGLIYLNAQAKKGREEHLSFIDMTNQSAPYRFAGRYAHWTEEQKGAAQNYISDYLGGHDTFGAVLELKEVGLSDEAVAFFQMDMTEALNSVDYTDALSDAWFEEKPVEVPLKPAEGTESEWQTTIGGYSLEGLSLLKADPNTETELQTYLNGLGLTADVKLKLMEMAGYSTEETDASGDADGNHATGLTRVPFDGYRAILHRNEAVLTSAQADVWRSGQTGGGNTGRLEALMSQMLGLLRRMAETAGTGQSIVLDSGVLVGQLAPAMNARLGTIGERNRRGNG